MPPWVCHLGHRVVPVEAVERHGYREMERFEVVDWWWAHVNEFEAHIVFDPNTGEIIEGDAMLPFEVD